MCLFSVSVLANEPVYKAQRALKWSAALCCLLCSCQMGSIQRHKNNCLKGQRLSGAFFTLWGTCQNNRFELGTVSLRSISATFGTLQQEESEGFHRRYCGLQSTPQNNWMTYFASGAGTKRAFVTFLKYALECNI